MLAETYSDDAAAIGKALADSLPSTAQSGEPDARPFTALCVDDADIKTLVQLRTRHQTRDASQGTRQVQSLPPTPSARPQSERERAYAAILKAIRSQTNTDNEQKGVATGLARSERHKTAPVAGSTGNAANAAVVAENESKRVFISAHLWQLFINDNNRHLHVAPLS